MLRKSIFYLIVFISFFLPLFYIRGFAFPAIFPHVMLVFFVSEIVLFLFLLNSISRNELVIKKSYLTISILGYIIILFISALFGMDFDQSFWSSYSRMTGIVTWFHLFLLFFVASAILQKEEWKYVFRSLILSSFILTLVSFLGTDGLAIKSFILLSKQGGSLLGNTSYNGSYLVLIVFLSFIGYALETRRLWKILYPIFILLIFFNPDLFNFEIWKGLVSFAQLKENPMLALGLARASTLVLWGGLLTIGILWVFHKLVNKKTTIFIATLGMFTILVASLYGISSITRGEGVVYDFYVKESGLARPMVWNMAKGASVARPLLGYGNENFEYVYQHNLDIKIMRLENPEWFDKVHNLILDELVNTGYVGLSAMFIIFCLVCYLSFRYYLREGKFYFLIIPFIFIFNFLQTQTFFLTDSILFLLFMSLAFLVSHEDDVSISIQTEKYKNSYYVALGGVFIAAFIYFIFIPIKQNRLFVQIANADTRSERVALYSGLTHFTHDPVETLRSLAGSFTNETAHRANELDKKGLTEKVQGEYQFYLDAYQSYYLRYEDHYRYLIEYARVINAAFIFKIDELKQGEELLQKAMNISDDYPHVYWLLAENLYYQKRFDEALKYAKAGYDLDPTIKQSIFLHEFIAKQVHSKSPSKAFLYISDL